MPSLAELLTGVSVRAHIGDLQVPVRAVVFDSRKVQPGDVFVATRGTTTDGHTYIPQTVAAGAVAVVCEELPSAQTEGVTYVQVENSAEALGQLAHSFYGRPSHKLKLVGVTGTNGKTTCATLLHRLFRELGYHCGLLSTVQNQIDETVLPATHTTPDAVALNELLAKMVQEGCQYAFMEVSSHAADQRRIAGLRFAGALFTNISHDHLDYHKTFDAYIKAKKLFFDGLPASAFALVNVDDKRGEVMLQNTEARRQTYALKKMADFKGRIIENSIEGLELEINGRQAWFKLIGTFNAYNLLAVYGAAVLLGEDEEQVLTVLSALKSATGRFDYLISASRITGIVDYAHTPDALENVLNTIQQIRQEHQRVITVVGCGGNRDAAKRPVMAQIAVKLSDQVVLTSDNPRDEDPQEILNQMQAGLKHTELRKTLTITDRKEAIRTAIRLAEPSDIILLAGKGHETYQEIKGIKYPFDDKEVLQETFAQMAK